MMDLTATVRDAYGKTQTPFRMMKGETGIYYVYLQGLDRVFYQWAGTTTNIIIKFVGTEIVKQISDQSLGSGYPFGYVYLTLTKEDLDALKVGKSDILVTFVDPLYTIEAVIKDFITVLALPT